MARTQMTGKQVSDGTVQRDDVDAATAGQALIRKVIAGTGVTITSTGADTGTGDVTINASGGGGGSSNVLTLDISGSSYTLVAGDNTGTDYVRYTTATGAKTFTVPTNATVAMSAGKSFVVRNDTTAGAITLTPGSGVTFVGTNLTVDINETKQLVRVAVDVWDVISGPTVAGATTQVQYNNAGAPAGSAGLTINATGDPSVTNYEDFLATLSSFTAPAAGSLRLGVLTTLGNPTLYMTAPNGNSDRVQRSLRDVRVSLWAPNTGAVITTLGNPATVIATMSHVSPTATSQAESIYRARVTTTATAGNASGLRDQIATMWGGNAAGRGGYQSKFIIMSGSLALSGCQVFAGHTSTLGTLASEPSAVTDCFAMIKDSGDTVWQFARRTGTGTISKVSLGVTYAANQMFDVEISMAQNGTAIFVRILQVNFDGTTTTLLDTSYNTSIPANTTFLARSFQVRNGAVAAAANLDWASAYLQNGY